VNHEHTHVGVVEEVRQARWLIALSAVMIGCGGFLLGVQIDAQGGASGTGWLTLGLGALVALMASLLRARSGPVLPRDGLAGLAAIMEFCALAFLVSAVLAPGGPWMFAELLLLLLLLIRRQASASRPLWLWWFAALLLFRFWITWQGSIHQWQVLSVPIPVLSWIPIGILTPIQSVELGSFTPGDLSFPPLGLDFRLTVAIWSAGFALCAGGLWILRIAAEEHENDRIHERIHTLPAPLARIVERILPEPQWRELGLHGLSDRQLTLRIEALVRDRVQRHKALSSEYARMEPLGWTNPGGFQGTVQSALNELEERNG